MTGIMSGSKFTNHESHDDYQNVVVSSCGLRVAVCKHHLQWLFQRRRPGNPAGGAAWDTFGYCRERASLVRLYRAENLEVPPEVLALPRHFSEAGN